MVLKIDSGSDIHMGGQIKINSEFMSKWNLEFEFKFGVCMHNHAVETLGFKIGCLGLCIANML